MSQLNWTEAQWNTVNSAITEEFTKANVAGACLPCYGPVGVSTEAVSKQRISYGDGIEPRIRILDDETTPFWTIRTYVELNGPQVADETLTSALFAFKRAANLLARTEDYLVFVGNDHEAMGAPSAMQHEPKIPTSFPAKLLHLLDTPKHKAPGLLTHPETAANCIPKPASSAASLTSKSPGETLVKLIAEAISELEKNGHSGPFACVLGQNAFLEAQTPNGSLVLPADRITPMLGGALLRSGSMPEDSGVVVSSGGESIDLVVATPPKAQFLHVNQDAKYVFRVYERFVLRIKDAGAVVPIKLA